MQGFIGILVGYITFFSHTVDILEGHTCYPWYHTDVGWMHVPSQGMKWEILRDENDTQDAVKLYVFDIIEEL